MMTAFIAICLIGTPVQQCQPDTAIHWIAAPEPQLHHGSCFNYGQKYAAQSQLVTKGTYLKVFCLSSQRRLGVNGTTSVKNTGEYDIPH